MDFRVDKSSRNSSNPAETFSKIEGACGSSEKEKSSVNRGAKSNKIAQLGVSSLGQKQQVPKSIAVHEITLLEGSSPASSYFRKISKANAKIVKSEVETERRNKRLAKTWDDAKSAFAAKLDKINQARQKSKP